MRLRKLDGLRGVASFVVLLHHALLTAATLAAPYFGYASHGSWSVALVRTPLHLLWDGPAAVSVFFVLSGFVLTLATERPGLRWLRFDAQRLVRLYVPVWGAVVVAAALAALVPRRDYVGDSLWMHAHDTPILPGVVAGATLLGGFNWLNGPLWSLEWEVLFSLALPVYLAAGRLVQRWWVMTPFMCGAISFVGVKLGSDAVVYLPTFLGGVVLAQHRQHVTAWVTRIGPRWFVLASVALFTAPWILRPDRALGTGRLPVACLAASLLVAACLPENGKPGFLETRQVQWLGRISFSLYLVHEPIVVSLAVLGLPPVMVLLVGVPLALGAAALFYRVIERPAHVLAKKISFTRAG